MSKICVYPTSHPGVNRRGYFPKTWPSTSGPNTRPSCLFPVSHLTKGRGADDARRSIFLLNIRRISNVVFKNHKRLAKRSMNVVFQRETTKAAMKPTIVIFQRKTTTAVEKPMNVVFPRKTTAATKKPLKVVFQRRMTQGHLSRPGSGLGSRLRASGIRAPESLCAREGSRACRL